MSLFLALALSWTLGTEIPVDPYTKVIPAAGSQSSPDIASNGRDALAVWIDHRAGSLAASARMTLLHGEHALEPYGVEIAAEVAAVEVASDGRDYLVAYSINPDDPDAATSARVATVENGRITQHTSIGHGNVVDVASDGATYCVITGSEYDPATPTAIVLTTDGTVVSTQKLPARGQAVLPRSGGGYWVVVIAGEMLQILPVSASGIGEARIIRSVPGVKYVSAIAGRNQILLSWRPDSRLGYLLLDGHLSPLGGLTLLRYEYEVTRAPSLAWDGREFFIGWQGPGGTYGVRVATDGKQVNPLGVRIADSSTELVAAFDGRRTILLTAEWPKPIERETPTIRARLIDSFATNVARAGSDVTFSGETQRTVSGAANDGTMLVLTIEGRGTLRHPNGSTTRVQAGLPEQRYGFVESVVAAQDVFLVVYRTGHSPLTGVAVRCVRHDGRVLEPLFLPTRENAREPAAATDGNAFLVVWNDAREDVQGARIGTDGTLESVFPIAAAGGALGNIEMAWTGEVFVLAGRTANGLGIARVTADGSQLGGLQSFPGAPGIEHERTSMAVGTSGDGALVLRAVEGCLLAVPVSRDGRVLREPRSVLCDQNFGVWPDLEIVWDGSAYTVAWSAELFVEGIPAVRTMRDGTVVTPVQNLDSSGGELADGTLLRAGEEVYLLYHRVVAEAPYAGVSRAFLRTVEVAGAPRRTRAARR